MLLSGTEMGGYDLFVDNVINKRENNNSYCEHCGRGCDEDNRYSQRNDYGGGGGGGGWRGGRNSRGGGVRGDTDNFFFLNFILKILINVF